MYILETELFQLLTPQKVKQDFTVHAQNIVYATNTTHQKQDQTTQQLTGQRLLTNLHMQPVNSPPFREEGTIKYSGRLEQTTFLD